MPMKLMKLQMILIFQRDLTPRTYVLHKIAIALKFMPCINQKLHPSYQTVLNYVLHKLKISGRSSPDKYHVDCAKKEERSSSKLAWI